MGSNAATSGASHQGGASLLGQVALVRTFYLRRNSIRLLFYCLENWRRAEMILSGPQCVSTAGVWFSYSFTLFRLEGLRGILYFMKLLMLSYMLHPQVVLPC
jgi:hypothetical protein